MPFQVEKISNTSVDYLLKELSFKQFIDTLFGKTCVFTEPNTHQAFTGFVDKIAFPNPDENYQGDAIYFNKDLSHKSRIKKLPDLMMRPFKPFPNDLSSGVFKNEQGNFVNFYLLFPIAQEKGGILDLSGPVVQKNNP